MNLIQLRYFQAVCACGNLTQAAQQLHISQPSLSSAIQTLEKEFGVGLFVRQYRGVELTAEGEQLLKLSRSLTENADKLVRIMQDLGAGRHILRLGVPPVLGGWLLPRLYTDFFATMRSSVWKSWKSGGRSSRKSWNMNFWILPSLFIHSPYTVDLSPFLSRTLNQEPSSPELIPLQGKSPASGKPICGKTGSYARTFLSVRACRGTLPQSRSGTSDPLPHVPAVYHDPACENGGAMGVGYKEMFLDDPDLCFLPFKEPLKIHLSLIWKKHQYASEGMKQLIAF